MYLHLGQDVIVREEDVIGIFDMDTATVSPRTREMMSRMEQTGRMIPVFDDLPKSCVLCRQGKQTVLYISQLSTVTLGKRAAHPLAYLGGSSEPKGTEAG